MCVVCYVPVFVHLGLLAHAHTCAHGEISIEGLPLLLSTFIYVFEAGSLPETRAHQLGKSWPSNSRDPLVSTFPVLEFQVHASIWRSTWVLGIWTQVLKPVQQVLYWLSHSPRPCASALPAVVYSLQSDSNSGVFWCCYCHLVGRDQECCSTF